MTEDIQHGERFINLRIAGLGCITLFLGLGWFGYHCFLKVSWGSVQATVIKVQSVRSSNASGSGSSTTYRPTVKFRDGRGRVRVLRTHYSSSMFNFTKGDRVSVIYNPRDSTDFRIITVAGFWVFPIGVIVFGIFIIVMAVWAR